MDSQINCRLFGNLNHRSQNTVFEASRSGENPPKFLFLKPKTFVVEIIAEGSLKAQFLLKIMHTGLASGGANLGLILLKKQRKNRQEQTRAILQPQTKSIKPNKDGLRAYDIRLVR